MIARLARLLRDPRGSTAIETAFAAPVLLMLSVGGFESSMMIARQAELQSAAAEAAAVVRAVIPEDAADRTVVKNILVASTGLAANKVSIDVVYRCGKEEDYEANTHNCAGGVDWSKFIQVRLQDSHTPIWTEFGIGSAVTYDVVRTVQIG